MAIGGSRLVELMQGGSWRPSPSSPSRSRPMTQGS